jgi:hypothetical protein
MLPLQPQFLTFFQALKWLLRLITPWWTVSSYGKVDSKAIYAYQQRESLSHSKKPIFIRNKKKMSITSKKQSVGDNFTTVQELSTEFSPYVDL